MRPRTCARRPTYAHTSSRTHSRTYTYIHPRTHTYARIRAREGNFLTLNLHYSIVKPSSIISPTPFTSIIQSLYNPYPYWHHIGCDICTNCQHLSSTDTHYHPLSSIRNYCPTIHRLLIIHSIICLTNSHTLSLPLHHLKQSIYTSYSIFIWFPFQPTHRPINMSVCYKTLSILYIFRAPINNSFSYTTVSHLSFPYQIHL